MSTTGKHPAQSYSEMTESMEEGKKKGLALEKGHSIYKEKSGEYQEDKLKGLDITNPVDHITIALKVEDVIKEHPDMRELFLLSEYKDMVTEISKPVDNESKETE